MSALSPHKDMKASNSNSSSSGCSAASSTTDIKKCRTDIRLSANRSRSFLHCLSKHLGRHFLHHTSHHHHHHTMHHNGQTIVYNSQEDLRSSSTDSFSLSYERNSHLDCVTGHLNGGISGDGSGGSNLDLSSAERTSSGSACSRFSPETDDLDNSASYRYSQRHIYLDTSLYRHASTFNCQNAEDELSEADSGNSSSDDNEGEDVDEDAEEQANKINEKESPTASVSPCCPLTNSSAKGLHLSRISITSSVRSMFQHITSASAAASSRSLSCSSTPLKRVWESKCKKTNSAPSNSSHSNKKSSTSTKASNNNDNNKKPEKKQQSILRPPISYVYMKGMSGLYSRVPRYTVCCPYGTQQWA